MDKERNIYLIYVIVVGILGLMGETMLLFFNYIEPPKSNHNKYIQYQHLENGPDDKIVINKKTSKVIKEQNITNRRKITRNRQPKF